MNHHSHNIYTSAIRVTCQSGRLDIHPPESLEKGNMSRETREVHYLRAFREESLTVTALCEACCPVCSVKVNPARITKGGGGV